MPHIIVEHSANLSDKCDLKALADEMNLVCQSTGVFPTGGIRVRMHSVETYSIADQHEDNAFMALILRVGAGREEEVLQECGRKVYECVCSFFSEQIESGFMAVSVDMEINDPALSFKRNGISDRLKRN